VRLNDAVNGIWISRDAQIGGGLYIAHYGGVIIGHVRIGSNCNIGNNVTIGKSTEGSYEDVPTIGNRVSIAVGSRILGKISVGHDALVGPNSVVMREVPQRGVVLGAPARQLARHGSFNHVSYRGMELDEQRSQSLAMIDKS
jgi:serine O-acetyltransferase